MSIFISYAREDRTFAERIYVGLTDDGIDCWLDTKSLEPGQNWRDEIKKAMRSSRFVILVLSEHSVSKRGVCQAELKDALEILREFPAGETFIIPVRLDNCIPGDLQLQDIQWFDLFPDYRSGLIKLSSHLRQKLNPADPVIHGSEPPKFVEANSISPFDTFGEFVRMMFSHFPRNFTNANNTISYYLLVKSQAPGVELPDHLVKKFPDQILLVLQHQFWDLQTDHECLRVTLWFGGEAERIVVPYSALRLISCPELCFEIEHTPEGFKSRMQS